MLTGRTRQRAEHRQDLRDSSGPAMQPATVAGFLQPLLQERGSRSRPPW
jgi:hypothetical protein